MKPLTLFLTFCCLYIAARAQTIANIDTALKFDQSFTKCEKKWVVLSKKDTVKGYNYGYVYIDHQAGFTYDLQGVFYVGDDGKYIRDTNIFKNTGSIKYRIEPNWQKVALLPQKHFTELGIKPEPDWVKIYYHYTDTIAHNYRWGWIYNDLGESAIALTYLELAHRLKPHAAGVEFEMAFAYNVLNRYDEAIKVLEPAIQNDPKNMFFYKELGYAFQHKKNYEKAIQAYKNGLEHAPDLNSESKGELAFNMAHVYKEQGNMEEYKNWMIKAKVFTPSNSFFYNQILKEGF